MNEPLFESFSIPITEGWKTLDAGQKTIRIKGVALKGDAISKNNRQYVAKELKKATNTWIGKPVNINHDNTKNVGTIKWMDYDEATDLLNYEAEITREPYVTLIRNKSAEIRGLSIQADYLFSACSRCGKRFYDEEEWHRHVTEEEFMKDMPTRPHGIVGTALSLVLSPEIPGYGGTSVELMEMFAREFLRLSETITKEEKLKEEYHMSRIAVRQEGGTIAFGKAGLKEDVKDDEDELAQLIKKYGAKGHLERDAWRGKTRGGSVTQRKWFVQDEGPNIGAKTELPTLYATGPTEGEDTVYDDEQPEPAKPKVEQPKTTAPNTATATTHTPATTKPLTITTDSSSFTHDEHITTDAEREAAKKKKNATVEFSLGEPCSPELKSCVDKLIADGKEESSAWAICKSKLGESIILKESKLGKVTWKPIVFEAFDSVLKETKDEARAGQIVKQNREVNEAFATLVATLNEVIDDANTPVTAKLPVSMDKALNDKIDGLGKAVAESFRALDIPEAYNDAEVKGELAIVKAGVVKLQETVAAIKPYDDKPMRESIANIKPYDDKELRMKIDAIKPYDDKPLQEKVAAIKPYDDTALKASIPKAYDDKPIKEELVTFNSKLTTLETENKNLKETVTKQKTDFDNLLSAADTRIKEEVAKRETELEETRKKVAEQEKVIRETVEKAEKAQVLSENTESKLKGTFKGKANDPTKQDKPDLTYKPAGGK